MDQPGIKYGSRPLFTPQKVIAVGDIHGMASELEALLQKILPLEPGTHLVFCGDLIDRGPESPRVLDLITEVYEKYPGQVFFVRGNHDWMLQTYCVNSFAGWMNFIGPTMEQMKQEWQLPDVLPSTIMQVLKDQGIWKWYFEEALPYYETEDLICTHAPLDFTQLLIYGAEHYEEDFKEDSHEPHFRFLLDRGIDLMWQFANEDEKRVDDLVKKFKICGHQFKHHKQPRIFRGRAYIDTGCGCVANRPLSALVYPGKKIIQSR
jgi:Icc-related predicted phosphoesterase